MDGRRSMSPVGGNLHSLPSNESQRQSVACPSLPTVSTPLVPVSSQPLSFSISRILGLEDNNTQSRPDSGKCDFPVHTLYVYVRAWLCRRISEGEAVVISPFKAC